MEERLQQTVVGQQDVNFAFCATFAVGVGASCFILQQKGNAKWATPDPFVPMLEIMDIKDLIDIEILPGEGCCSSAACALPNLLRIQLGVCLADNTW